MNAILPLDLQRVIANHKVNALSYFKRELPNATIFDELWKCNLICPFCHHKKFRVWINTGKYRCKSCGIGGKDIVDFTIEKYHLTQDQALQKLAIDWAENFNSVPQTYQGEPLVAYLAIYDHYGSLLSIRAHYRNDKFINFNTINKLIMSKKQDYVPSLDPYAGIYNYNDFNRWFLENYEMILEVMFSNSRANGLRQIGALLGSDEDPLINTERFYDWVNTLKFGGEDE